MILGPSRWRPGTDRRDLDPERLAPALPEGRALSGEDPPTPLDVRAAAAGLLRTHGTSATLMEFHDRREGESNTDLFLRIRRTQGVEGFLVYWPHGAQRAGLDWELGLLVGEISRGETPPDDVVLLVEEAAASIRPADGALESHERGRRTRYYDDLVEHGCPFAVWRHHGEFLEAVLAWAGR